MEKKTFKLELVPKLIIAISLATVIPFIITLGDSFGSACNVFGNNAIGVVVNTIYKKFIVK